MKHAYFGMLLASVLCTAASAQAPEIIQFTFDAGDATNTAVPGVGNGTPLSGVSFAPSQVCSSGQSAVSTGGTSVQIDTGWQVDLGTSDWSVGMHLDLIGVSTSIKDKSSMK
ncbi:MAG TPA: hypothetical protein PLJ12_15115 [Planctomycetota bacterium]|nr:hypothetical protein [Planctomycetota bacterium]